MNRTITHKHLKRQFDIFDEAEEIENLFLELEYSTLLLPVSLDEDNPGFPLIQFEDRVYAPVFTDIHEFNKLKIDGNFTLMPNSFDFYLNLLDNDIDGIVIDIEGERFPICKEVKDCFKPNHAFDYESNAFTLNEIKNIRNQVNNEELEEFLRDETNHWDFEGLIDILLRSDIFTVGLSIEDLSGRSHDGIIMTQDVGKLPLALTSMFSESYALIYSSQDEIKPKNNPLHPYSQLVNLPELIKKVLLDDLDGIILNENSHRITIPREFLLDYIKDFSTPDLNRYDDYAFILEG